MNAINEPRSPLGGKFPSGNAHPCDPLALTGHRDLVGLLAGLSLAADQAAPVPTPVPDPEAKASLQDLASRVNLLLRAQAFTLAAVAELLEVGRAARGGAL